MDYKKSDKLIHLLDKVYRILKFKPSTIEINRWIKNINRSLSLFKNRLRSMQCIGEQNRCLKYIGFLECLAIKFKNLKKKKTGGGGGGGVALKRRDRVRWKDLETAFESRIRTGLIVNLRHKNLEQFLKDARKLLLNRLTKILRTDSGLKVNVILFGKFAITTGDVIIQDGKHFNTRNTVILQSTNLREWFNENVRGQLLAKVEDFQDKGSGWSMVEIINLTVNINKYVPLRGGVSTYVEMPVEIQRKKAVVNMENMDPYCFAWSVTAALHPMKMSANRTSSYPNFRSILNCEGIDFPMSMKDISKFEKLNNLSINVYGIEEPCEIVPLYLSREKNSEKPTIHLLAIETEIRVNENDHNPVYHYAWIRNLSRLVKSQISKHKCATWICDRCLSHFSTENLLLEHREDCETLNHCKVILPKPYERVLSFKNYRYKESVPFAIYADLECLLEPIIEEREKREKSNTNAYQKHVPHSAAYYIHCTFDDSISTYKAHRGADCVEWFVNELQTLAQSMDVKLTSIVPMSPLSETEIREFDSAESCHICEEPFKPDDIKCHDHCHLTGKYRGAAHADCNLNYKDSHMIPVIFHNLSGYDSHFMIRELARIDGEMSLLPINKEKYISFTKSIEGTTVNFRFIDSFRFMPSSIEKLARNLANDKKQITRKNCTGVEEFELLTSKGVFPYDYVDCWEKLDETELPSKEKFHSELNNDDISESEYLHACNVWKTLDIGTLGEYSDLYLKTDVLLLADIFQNFRQKCLLTYNLDPLHYYTAPGLAFDAMLKYTGVELELLTDIDMVMFVERGIRGGLAQCSNRYGEANNRYMGSEYDPSKDESYLMYYDVNNLYGAAMSQYLPTGSFKWEENFEDLDIHNISKDAPTGYIFEVDLEYPKELHSLHKDLPLCPEPFAPPTRDNAKPKLMTTLYPKKRYIIHYRNLQQCLDLGLKLTKIHRVLKFEQSPWLKKYIDLNTEQRQKSTSKFEQDFYKLMNNAVFGKTMENVRKYRDVKLIRRWDGRYGARALIAKPNFHSCTIFDENMLLIEMNRMKIKFNKPIYVGYCILDISKIYIYDFHYKYVKTTLGERVKLMYTDTDSLIYHIKVPDIYEIMKRDIERFDTSNYAPDNVYDMPLTNKMVLGVMKDENKGKIMQKFVGLRAKMYCYEVQGVVEKRAKGVKSATLRTITFDDYERCLLCHRNVKRNQNLIRSRKHRVETVRQNKLALSWNDDKRVISLNDIETLPWGFTV